MLGEDAVTAKAPFRLCLVTDRRAARRPLLEVVSECVDAGLEAVQLREKDLPVRELLSVAKDLVEIAARRGARVIVNDRADVALAAEAHGVQRTEASLPVAALRRVVPPPRLIGASVHSLAAAREAAGQGADFLVFGPVYDTPSKRPYGPPQGLAQLEEVCRAVAVPVIAIGGIARDRVADVIRAGASGVAAISAILCAERPGDATREMLEALDRA